MLLIMCVDGLDIEKMDELGLGMKYNKSLSIPKECYVSDDVNTEPHTLKVWATIFTGRIKDKDIRPFQNISILEKIVKILYKIGSKIKDEKMKRYPFTYPVYIKDDSVFKTRHSFDWNIPTLSIDYVHYLYDWYDHKEFCIRELNMFESLAFGSLYSSFELFAVYTRIIDVFGHYKINTDNVYKRIFYIANELSKKTNLFIISDHGTRYENGYHTDKAYLGSNIHVDIESILDIRRVIEDNVVVK